MSQQSQQCEESGYAIGISFGTAYACVCVWKNDAAEILSNEHGNRTTPCCVAFTDTECKVGEAAVDEAATNPSTTVYGLRRIVGRSFTDPLVEAELQRWPFKVVASPDNRPVIEIPSSSKGGNKHYSPEEIIGLILGKMKRIACGFLGTDVRKTVITVPEYFNDVQRQAIRNAGAIAGLEVQRIVNEPWAATVAYGLDRALDEQNVLVLDLGSCTLDVTLLNVDGGLADVLATAGNLHLGGDSFVSRLVTNCISDVNQQHSGMDVSQSKSAVARLTNACESAMRALSTASHATIEVESLFDGIDFRAQITRARFDEICTDLLQTTLTAVEHVLEKAKLDKREVHEIVLIGGATRLPKFRQLVSAFFEGKEAHTSINPDEAVAYGAAVLAFIINGGKSKEAEALIL